MTPARTTSPQVLHYSKDSLRGVVPWWALAAIAVVWSTVIGVLFWLLGTWDLTNVGGNLALKMNGFIVTSWGALCYLQILEPDGKRPVWIIQPKGLAGTIGIAVLTIAM